MLLIGCEDILETKEPSMLLPGFFEDLFDRMRSNWVAHALGRLPSLSNWQLRVAEKVTPDANGHFEKQLEKAIVMSLHAEGWGNAVPTASGLVNSRLRQMNIDLAHRISGGLNSLNSNGREYPRSLPRFRHFGTRPSICSIGWSQS